MLGSGAGAGHGPATYKKSDTHYGRLHKRVVHVVAAVGLGLVGIVLTQLLYPPGRLLPFVRINGTTYGGQANWDVIRQLEATYKYASIEVQGGNVTSRASLQQVGLAVQTTPTVLRASQYSVGQRLIPFSSLAIMLTRDVPVQVRVDKERVRYFAEQFEQQSTVPAVNASVAVTGGQVSLVPAKPSKKYPAEAIYQAIVSAPLAPKVRLQPKPVSEPAPISDQAVKQTLGTAQRVLDIPLVLRIGEVDVAVDKEQVAGWFDFVPNGTTVELHARQEAIEAYVSSLHPQGYQAPRATRITVVDGQETGRVMGIAGRGVDVAAAAEQIATSIRSGQGGTIALATVALTPGITYDRSYSQTSAGLSAFLSDIVARKGNYAIAVVELGGKGRSGSAQGDKVYVAASTYKLFIAYAVFQLTANGEMQWDESIGGMRADACFEAMIVQSDNGCSWAFGQRIGWGRIEDLIRSAGLSHTTLTDDGDGKYTTANDLALYMQKLHDGSLLPSASRDLLISYMKRQIYRNGIPAATGVTVANKVGGYGSYVHDAGIVYAPGGSYVMVVMTSGAGWPALTATAKEVHQFVTR